MLTSPRAVADATGSKVCLPKWISHLQLFRLGVLEFWCADVPCHMKSKYKHVTWHVKRAKRVVQIRGRAVCKHFDRQAEAATYAKKLLQALSSKIFGGTTLPAHRHRLRNICTSVGGLLGSDGLHMSQHMRRLAARSFPSIMRARMQPSMQLRRVLEFPGH